MRKLWLFIAIIGFMFLFFGCTPNYPTETPPESIQEQGATPQYSFFSYTQMQYPQEKDIVQNTPDASGQFDSGGQDTGAEGGFVFDF